MSLIHTATHNAANRRGYRLQINCHAPDGYDGAYSLSCFSDKKADRHFSLSNRYAAARADIQHIVQLL